MLLIEELGNYAEEIVHSYLEPDFLIERPTIEKHVIDRHICRKIPLDVPKRDPENTLLRLRECLLEVKCKRPMWKSHSATVELTSIHRYTAHAEAYGTSVVMLWIDAIAGACYGGRLDELIKPVYHTGVTDACTGVYPKHHWYKNEIMMNFHLQDLKKIFDLLPFEIEHINQLHKKIADEEGKTEMPPNLRVYPEELLHWESHNATKAREKSAP